jgi:hypothetical protein
VAGPRPKSALIPAILPVESLKEPWFQGVQFVAGNGMTKTNSKRGWSRAALAGLLGVAMLISCAAQNARAEDDDEDAAPDVKVLRHILYGLGLRRNESGIDYRERPPLVLPPARDLPPPQLDAAANKAAGWPDDPDVKLARQMKQSKRKVQAHVEGVDDRPLRPDEFSRAPPPGRGDGQPIKSAEEAALPSSLAELGSKSIFTWNSLWGSKEEYATFAGEPPRSSLIDPPAGYRTPSPNQPYGVGKEKWTPPPTDRHVDPR